MRRRIKTRNKFCFASEFEKAREFAGFPLSGAAKICCVSVKTIKNWESGITPCPAWALRLIILESRYMDALYGIQRDRSTGFALGLQRSATPANDAIYSTQLPLKLVS